LIPSFPSDVSRLKLGNTMQTWAKAQLEEAETKRLSSEKELPNSPSVAVAVAILSPACPAQLSWSAARCRRGRSQPVSVWCVAVFLLVVALYLRCHCPSVLAACTPSSGSWSVAPRRRGRLNQARGWRVKEEFDSWPSRSLSVSPPSSLCKQDKINRISNMHSISFATSVSSSLEKLDA
jgi:hypothetical protein